MKKIHTITLTVDKTQVLSFDKNLKLFDFILQLRFTSILFVYKLQDKFRNFCLFCKLCSNLIAREPWIVPSENTVEKHKKYYCPNYVQNTRCYFLWQHELSVKKIIK